MGHATLQRTFGGHPWITLYGFGGLASCNDCDRSPWRRIIILLAGPFAGFLLAGIVIAVLVARGHYEFVPSWIPIVWRPIDTAHFLQQGSFGLPDIVVWDLLQVNILWGLFNLLPVYPLDGGQIARELFALGNPRLGIIWSLQLSVGVAAILAVYALLHHEFFLGLMFGYLAFASFQTLQAYRNHWRG